MLNQPSSFQPQESWSTIPTQPVDNDSRRQREYYQPAPQWMKPRKKRAPCCLLFFIGFLLVIPLLIYIFFPLRSNIIVLGIDYTQHGNFVGRTDTIILITVTPLKPYIGMLSIPRDLWVNIPNLGENRINTAHFFAEANQPGSGPQATIDTVKANFGITIDYYVRIRFEGLRDIVDAMGGVDIVLPQSIAGYPPGLQHLNGNKALAFARYRAGSDDFFRMEHGQLLIKSMIKQLVKPKSWNRLPQVLVAALRSIDTNIPAWQLPRLIIALLRIGPEGIDNRIISRDMTTPFTTSQGASVLIPNWKMINPVIKELFSQ